MEYIIQVAISTVLVGAAMFASIWLVDRYNSRNKLPTAFFVAAVLSFFAPMSVGFLAILPLVALFYILLNFYELGFLKSIAVIAATGLGVYGASHVLQKVLMSGMV